MELRPGTILHNYTILEQIGAGGMGKVYLAEETLLDRKAAIKVLNPLITQDEQFRQRFLNEAKIQASLMHPHIVGLYSFFDQSGIYYMAMEYAEGITLKELIRRTGPIPEQRTLHIFRQLISALGYAHSKQIIHRDIKPSNIVIDANDNIKVMDFGIARLMSDKHLTQTGAKLGTLFYMSPEQVMADKNIDYKTDIYSAGIVLYEMLTGRLPFNADTDSDYIVMKEIAESATPDPRAVYPHISAATVSMLNALTDKDKNYRPGADKVFAASGQRPAKPKVAPEQTSKPVVTDKPVPAQRAIPKVVTQPPAVKPKDSSFPFQQVLLALMGIVIVGVTIAVGITMFSNQAFNSNQQAVASELQTYASMAIQFYKTPASQGGAGQDTGKVTTKTLSDYMGFSGTDGTLINDNGSFKIVDGEGAKVVLEGIGTEAKSGRYPKVISTVDMTTANINNTVGTAASGTDW